MTLQFRTEKLTCLSTELDSALVLDTSEMLARIGCYNAATKTLYETTCPATQKPSESILTSIQACLQEAQLPLKEIKAMLVGLGPGSFTGLRVGLATMKGLAMGAQVPLYGFCSLEALALSHQANVIVPVRNAQRGDVFAGAFANKGTSPTLENIIPVGLFRPEDFAAQLDALATQQIALLGESASLLKPHLKNPEQYLFTTTNLNTESALVLKQNDILEERLIELNALSPAYLRLSAAEENIKNT